METEKSVCEKKGWENIMSLFFTSLFTSDNHSDLRWKNHFDYLRKVRNFDTSLTLGLWGSELQSPSPAMWESLHIAFASPDPVVESLASVY